jgi:hypothetical protein
MQGKRTFPAERSYRALQDELRDRTFLVRKLSLLDFGELSRIATFISFLRDQRAVFRYRTGAAAGANVGICNVAA